jgi:Ca-activated chloride channel family protein
VVTAGPRFDVLAAEPGTDGQPVFIATSYEDGVSFDLPPGKYVMRASSDAATADTGFEVKAGPPIEVIVILDAGILAVSAPAGDFLELFSAKKDIYGEQQSVAYTYGESWQVTVPAGDYVLKVKKTDGSESETPATVKAGERTEVTAN